VFDWNVGGFVVGGWEMHVLWAGLGAWFIIPFFEKCGFLYLVNFCHWWCQFYVEMADCLKNLGQVEIINQSTGLLFIKFDAGVFAVFSFFLCHFFFFLLFDSLNFSCF